MGSGYITTKTEMSQNAKIQRLSYINMQSDERRRAISFTQATLDRLKKDDASVKKLIHEFSLRDHREVLAYVHRHFGDKDIQIGLGLNTSSIQTEFIRLSRLLEAIDA